MCSSQAMVRSQLMVVMMMVIMTISKNESQVPCFIPESGGK